MKIEFKYEFNDLSGHKTIEIHHVTYASELEQIMQDMRYFLLAIGFQPNSIDNYIEAN